MNKRVKALWMEALQSGEYSQTKGVLKEIAEDGKVSYCCLGVLCEIAKTEGIVKDYREVQGSDGLSLGIFDGDGGVLPLSVRKWADIGSGTGIVGKVTLTGPYNKNMSGQVHSLSALNDAYGYDFNMIADVIDAQL